MALPMQREHAWTLEELAHIWTLGDKFTKSRELAGLTQEEMAAALTARGRKTSKQTISNWETEGNQPKRLFEAIALWAEITGFPEEWFRTRCFSSSVQVAGLPPMLGQTALDFAALERPPFVPRFADAHA